MSQGETYLLLYSYVEDMAERRGPHREAHLERIRAEKEAGRVVMAGALSTPPPEDGGGAGEGEGAQRPGPRPTGGAIVWRGVAPSEIEAFTAADPYVQAGLVTSQRIERWTLV